MFDLVRRPTFDHTFREAWDAYVAVNRAFADAVAERAAPGEVVLVQDYQLDAGAGHGRRGPPRPPRRATSPTPRSAARTRSGCCPTDVAEALLRSMHAVPCGFHTERWARAYTGLGPRAPRSGRRTARRSRRRSVPTAPTSARSRHPTRPAPPSWSSTTAIHDRRMILRIDRIEPSKNIVRGFVAFDRLLVAHPEWRAQRRVRRVAQPVAASRSPSTSRTARRSRRPPTP